MIFKRQETEVRMSAVLLWFGFRRRAAESTEVFAE